MNMTHYMELLAVNQPWNLFIFMGIPVILAETLAITEIYLLFVGHRGGIAGKLSRLAGLIAGFYFLGILAYLIPTVVIPLTQTGGWRGPADIIAVATYLLGALPMAVITMVNLNLVGGGDEYRRRKIHIIAISIFLVLAHIAMVFGMMDPAVMGWHGTPTMDHSQTNHAQMGH